MDAFDRLSVIVAFVILLAGEIMMANALDKQTRFVTQLMTELEDAHGCR